MKITVQGIGQLFVSYWTGRPQRSPKQHELLQLYGVTYCNYKVGLYIKYEDITYFAAGHREINLKLTWKFLCCWLAFTVLEGVLQAPEKRH